MRIAVRISPEDIGHHHAALFLGPAVGDPGGTLAILFVLLLLLLSAAALLLLGIASLAWLFRPSEKEVDVVPLETDGNVFWVPVSKGERRRVYPRTTSQPRWEKDDGGDSHGGLRGS